MMMEKLSKLKRNIASETELKPVVISLSAEEREERIQYLVNLFRLTFRTDYGFMEFIRDTDDIQSEYYYYEEVTGLDYGCYARYGSEEEMEEYRAKFQALDAEDKFIECCIDYYKDVNTELKVSLHKLKAKLKVLANKQAEALPFDKKKKHWIRNRRRPLEDNLDVRLRKKQEVEKKLAELYKARKALKQNKDVEIAK